MAANQAKTRRRVAGRADITPGSAADGLQTGEQARRQAERLQSVQTRLLDIYSSFMTHWLQRRQSAAQAALDAAQRALADGDRPATLPQIYGEWMQGSLERIAADIRECQECGSEIIATMQDSLPLPDRDLQGEDAR